MRSTGAATFSLLVRVAVIGVLACSCGNDRATESTPAPVRAQDGPQTCGALLITLTAACHHAIPLDQRIRTFRDGLAQLPDRMQCLRGLMVDVGEDSAVLIHTLATLYTSAPEVVRAWRQDPDPRVRAAALAALSLVSDQTTTADVVVGLDDPDPQVRHAAVVGLRSIRPISGETLARIEAKLVDPSPRVRGAAASTLGAFPEASGAVLAKLLVDADADVQVRAIYALKNIGYRQAERAIAALVDSPRPSVRAAAVAAVGFFDAAHAKTAPSALVLDPSGDDAVTANLNPETSHAQPTLRPARGAAVRAVPRLP